MEGLKFGHICFLSWPDYSHAFLLAWFWDYMKMDLEPQSVPSTPSTSGLTDVVHNLMRNSAIVLQYVVV